MAERVQVIMGKDAPSIGEQFPELNSKTAAHLTKDVEAVSRLILRGVLTDSTAEKARAKLAKNISEAVSNARTQALKGGGDM